MTSPDQTPPSAREDVAVIRWQTGRDIPTVEQRHKDAAAWALDCAPDSMTWDQLTNYPASLNRVWQANRVAEAFARYERDEAARHRQLGEERGGVIEVATRLDANGFAQAASALARHFRLSDATPRVAPPANRAGEAPYGWVMFGPDGNWHWATNKDLHECIEDQRPATSLEKVVFNRFGNCTENLAALASPSTPPAADAGEVERLREALERIARARSVLDGGSIMECRQMARAALASRDGEVGK